jgi:hypothetical protein
MDLACCIQGSTSNERLAALKRQYGRRADAARQVKPTMESAPISTSATNGHTFEQVKRTCRNLDDP